MVAMSRDDFDLPSLARYLHLPVDRVTKLVERGQLPGRRIAGQWRFSSEEVHHWLEDRLGAGDVAELRHVEEVLAKSPDRAPQISLARLLDTECIRIPLEARTRGSVITSMVELAAQGGLLWDIEKMMEAVRMRENLHPTALECGVALLHPRRPLPHILGDSFLAFGRTSSGIPFGNARLTDVFFLICALDDATHLAILARLSRLLLDPPFVDNLRAASTAQELLTIVQAAEDAAFGTTS
jgi:PTS system nitrogen regulatory IIA component